MLICCGLFPNSSSTEVMEVIAQTTLELKAAVAREMADLCGRSGIVNFVLYREDFHNKIFTCDLFITHIRSIYSSLRYIYNSLILLHNVLYALTAWGAKCIKIERLKRNHLELYSLIRQ